MLGHTLNNNYLYFPGAGLTMTVLSSTAMTSVSVQVTGPVWEPISVDVRPVGTVGRALSPTVRDCLAVSLA